MPAFVITSVAATHYTGALLENQVEVEAFPGLRGNEHGEIEGIIVKSLENLDWRVEMYDYSGNIINAHEFVSTDAIVEEVDEVTWYVYTYNPIEEWAIPVIVPAEAVNIGLRNKSSQAKTAGANGYVVVKFVICK